MNANGNVNALEEMGKDKVIAAISNELAVTVANVNNDVLCDENNVVCNASSSSSSSNSSGSNNNNNSDLSNCVACVHELPDEILEFILTYLPPYKDLENCSMVCKRWQNIVKDLVRRAKMNLHKGLSDFKLRWLLLDFESSTAAAAAAVATAASSANTPPPVIAGRFSHSAVRHHNSMYIFGGGSSSDTTFNDLWRFDLSSMRWERPLSTGSYPSPKGSASLVCWRDQLVLFGGWRYPSLHPPFQPWCLFDELHFYDLESNRWVLHYNARSPPPMAGHSASVHGDCMVIFGGYQIADGVNSNSNDTWCYDLVQHEWWQPRFAATATAAAGNSAIKKPAARYGQYQLALDDEHALIVGGCGGPNSVYSDAWLLDMTTECWSWRSIPVQNKKYAAAHMWCNPACKIDSKLVVLGPTPNMPHDFQMRLPMHAPRPSAAAAAAVFLEAARPGIAPNRINNFRLLGGAGGAQAADLNAQEQYFANRRAILNQHHQQQQQQLHHNNNNNVELQPRSGRLSDLHATPAQDMQNQNAASTSAAAAVAAARPRANRLQNNNDAEAANRLQRNLALRCRENEPMLPKRFDELHEDPFRMAAFNVSNMRARVGVGTSRDHNERIRRLEEKMNSIRNSRRHNAAAPPANQPLLQHNNNKCIKEPSPKRIRRNVLSLFVCDLSAVLDPHEPRLQWLEYKNYGVMPGAPERLILSTMVAGNGELILFGGVHKETLSEITHQVSNAVHFLSAPKNIV